MLTELTITDFAIIDRLNLRLNPRFNVFTGETGAGKSIILDAVSAVIGGKVGTEVVRSGAERATVYGTFSVGALPTITQPLNGTNGATADTTEASSNDEARNESAGQDEQVDDA